MHSRWGVRIRELFILLLLFATSGLAGETERRFRNLDLRKILFGIEYTFQDVAMQQDLFEREPGGLILGLTQTPYKRKKLGEFASHYLAARGLAPSQLVPVPPTDRNGGYRVTDPDGRSLRLMMDPGVLEMASRPLHFDEIEEDAAPLFTAAKHTGLVSYVEPAGLNAGGGHVHVGGRTLGDSPFVTHPNLLRNVLVYFHKHPSLLYGFSDVFDVGPESTVAPFHTLGRQHAFRRALERFDGWYAAQASPRGEEALQKFLAWLQEEPSARLVAHDNFINLEHLPVIPASRTANVLDRTGKLTVEFRGFRSPRSPAHAKAYANLLLHVFDRLAEPGYLESFEEVSRESETRFYCASKVAADWERVKAELRLVDPVLDGMIQEYRDVSHSTPLAVPGLPGAELFPSFSDAEHRGHFFELRVPARDAEPPGIVSGNLRLAFERVSFDGDAFWIAHFAGDPTWVKQGGARPGEIRRSATEVVSRGRRVGVRCASLSLLPDE